MKPSVKIQYKGNTNENGGVYSGEGWVVGTQLNGIKGVLS